MVNMNQLMKQAQAMQKKMADMQEDLSKKEYEGVAGGDSVKVTINGKLKVKNLKISPEIVDKDEIEVLEDLIVAAMNDAQSKAEEDSKGDLSSMMGGMQLPPGMKLPF